MWNCPCLSQYFKFWKNICENLKFPELPWQIVRWNSFRLRDGLSKLFTPFFIILFPNYFLIQSSFTRKANCYYRILWSICPSNNCFLNISFKVQIFSFMYLPTFRDKNAKHTNLCVFHPSLISKDKAKESDSYTQVQNHVCTISVNIVLIVWKLDAFYISFVFHNSHFWEVNIAF